MLIELAVVIPVYNEEDCIVGVIESWHSLLRDLNINFRIIILNDGSTDGTKLALAAFAHDDCIELINKQNSGHGPTVLAGFRQARHIAEWVFQCDSDNEMKAEHFPILWERRTNFDALLGTRVGRNQNLSRRLITACSRKAVQLMFGRGITDVNVPYRLIRSTVVRQITAQIPANAFAPNVIISGMLLKGEFRIYQHPIPFNNRETGVSSIAKWRIWPHAVRSFWQTVSFRRLVALQADENQ